MNNSLKKVNFRNNKIRSLDNLDYLAALYNLKWVNLNENPIQDKMNYRINIKEKLSEAESIDIDEDLDVSLTKENTEDNTLGGGGSMMSIEQNLGKSSDLSK